MKKYCRTCIFKAKANTGEDACRLHSSPQRLHIIDLNKDYCSSHQNENEGQRCDACGQTSLREYILLYRDCPSENPPQILCNSCYARYGTCAFCESANYCDFEQNPIAIPPVVMKTVQQGYMTMQTQVRNPDRIAETCAKNCKCWDHEHGYCRREDSWCNNYKDIL